mmetsp:Transcript_8585/g.25857  ORF Transcript_8585/g.25857 Transcript_8585/m.25857 type:complete len:343 (+) Transcript_8585:806-1834(+)
MRAHSPRKSSRGAIARKPASATVTKSRPAVAKVPKKFLGRLLKKVAYTPPTRMGRASLDITNQPILSFGATRYRSSTQISPALVLAKRILSLRTPTSGFAAPHRSEVEDPDECCRQASSAWALCPAHRSLSWNFCAKSHTAALSVTVSSRNSAMLYPVLYGYPRDLKYAQGPSLPPGPRYTTLPPLSRMTESSREKITGEGWWMVTTMVQPLRCSLCLTMCITSLAMAESNPVVGSSKKMALGLYSSPMEIATRFLSPPLTPLRPTPGLPTTVFAALSSDICFRTWFTLWIFSSFVHLSWGSLHIAAKSTSSKTVKCPMQLKTSSLCSTYEASLLTSAMVGW